MCLASTQVGGPRRCFAHAQEDLNKALETFAKMQSIMGGEVTSDFWEAYQISSTGLAEARESYFMTNEGFLEGASSESLEISLQALWLYAKASRERSQNRFSSIAALSEALKVSNTPELRMSLEDWEGSILDEPTLGQTETFRIVGEPDLDIVGVEACNQFGLKLGWGLVISRNPDSGKITTNVIRAWA